MATYVMTHDGGAVQRIVSGAPDVQTDLTDMMIALSNKKAGKFFLFSVEKSKYKGWETYTLIAVVEDGEKLGCEKQVTCSAKFGSITALEWERMIKKAQISKIEMTQRAKDIVKALTEVESELYRIRDAVDEHNENDLGSWFIKDVLNVTLDIIDEVKHADYTPTYFGRKLNIMYDQGALCEGLWNMTFHDTIHAVGAVHSVKEMHQKVKMLWFKLVEFLHRSPNEDFLLLHSE